jgi:hypothetical protein
MDKYWFSGGGMVDIQGISIIPNTSSKVQALCFYKSGEIQMKFLEITGDEYTNWGNDDDYLVALVGHKLGMGERLQPVSSVPDLAPTKPFTPYTFKSGIPAQPSGAAPVADGASQVYHDDSRSVHNEADIAKITTLEEQMVEQQRMVAQLKSILISKGMI